MRPFSPFLRYGALLRSLVIMLFEVIPSLDLGPLPVVPYRPKTFFLWLSNLKLMITRFNLLLYNTIINPQNNMNHHSNHQRQGEIKSNTTLYISLLQIPKSIVLVIALYRVLPARKQH
ncbi:hypothetical protein L1987_50010 [Smallanthus sonchifolius]|uniref:Uncharacterized protein n=1 Tax=Smallanthus sonchifolius TaxID=185202 RepID=A0ACB9FVM9_9ASTR|nr:hypothetical protein L1987_50010 [Smallanthus sonchifolius]